MKTLVIILSILVLAAACSPSKVIHNVTEPGDLEADQYIVSKACINKECLTFKGSENTLTIVGDKYIYLKFLSTVYTYHVEYVIHQKGKTVYNIVGNHLLVLSPKAEFSRPNRTERTATMEMYADGKMNLLELVLVQPK